MEPTETKEQERKGNVRRTGPESQAPGTEKGIYVNLRGCFTGCPDHSRIRLPGNTGQGAKEPDITHRRNENGHLPGKDGRARQHDRQTRQKRHTAYNGQPRHSRHIDYGGHGFRDTVRHGQSMYGEEEFSSTCCGKCRYFLRPWRSRVWVCSNEESEKNGFPANYASTCPLFAREDWQRDSIGHEKTYCKIGEKNEKEERHLPCSEICQTAGD